MSSVVVTLNLAEREALVKLAIAEVRTPRDQARYILRQELKRYGLLPADDGPGEGQAVEVSDD